MTISLNRPDVNTMERGRKDGGEVINWRDFFFLHLHKFLSHLLQKKEEERKKPDMSAMFNVWFSLGFQISLMLANFSSTSAAALIAEQGGSYITFTQRGQQFGS